MNLILFEKHEISGALSLDDPRAVHLLSVLRRKKGEPFDAGIIGGPRGKGSIQKITADSLILDFQFPVSSPGESLYPVTLVVGLPRPQTARKILREITSLGVSQIYFTGTERGEDSYKRSSLWTTGEVRKHLVSGAEQAFDTLLPEVRVFSGFTECLDALSPGEHIALDNYEGVHSLNTHTFSGEWTSILVGPEKGWSPGERNLMRKKGVILAHLGKRVLRTETAAVAGVALVLAGMGFF